MKCFYHNDLDGKSAAALIWARTENPRKQDFIKVDYNKSVPDPCMVWPNEQVFIVDYSFTEPTKHQLTGILAKTKDVVWLDHHLSSQELLDNDKELNDTFFNHYCDCAMVNPHATIDMEKSGAMLVWEYFNPEVEAPEYIKYIDDYDRWVHQYEESILYKLFVESYMHEPWDEIWEDMLYRDMLSMVNEGGVIKRFDDVKNTKEARAISFESTILGIPCIAICKPGNSSALAEKFSQYPLGIVFQYRNGTYTYSVYSKTVNCKEIAEYFGGGGHKGAAGFTSDYIVLGHSKSYHIFRKIMKKLFK